MWGIFLSSRSLYLLWLHHKLFHLSDPSKKWAQGCSSCTGALLLAACAISSPGAERVLEQGKARSRVGICSVTSVLPRKCTSCAAPMSFIVFPKHATLNLAQLLGRLLLLLFSINRPDSCGFAKLKLMFCQLVQGFWKVGTFSPGSGAGNC